MDGSQCRRRRAFRRGKRVTHRDPPLTTTMKRKCLAIACAIAFGGAGLGARAAGALENPAPGAVVSGIGVISGWFCSAGRIEVQIDAGVPMPAAYGTDRLDTASTCGKRDTGFGLLLNWAVVGAGPHTIR